LRVSSPEAFRTCAVLAVHFAVTTVILHLIAKTTVFDNEKF
jgi:hypothetical protein